MTARVEVSAEKFLRAVKQQQQRAKQYEGSGGVFSVNSDDGNFTGG